MSTAVRPAIGANASVTMGDETVQGTPAASMDYRYDFTSESISATENTLESASIRRGRRRPQTIRGTIDVSGDLNAELAPVGFGRMYRHALGLAETAMADTDGSAHGRIGSANGDSVADTVEFIEFPFDNVAGFVPTVLTVSGSTPWGISAVAGGGDMFLMYQDDDDAIVVDPTTFTYEEFQPVFASTVGIAATHGQGGSLLNTSASSGSEGATGTNIIRILGSSSNILNTLNGSAWATTTNFGYFYVEFNDVVHRLGYDWIGRVNGTTFDARIVTIDGVAIGGTSPSWISGATDLDGAPVYAPATLYQDTGLLTGHSIAKGYGLANDEIPSGAWLLARWTEADTAGAPTLYTSYFQVGPNLPVGLTVEVLRDAANFVYTGMQINEWSVTIDSQAVTTTTHSLIGIQEYCTIALVKPVVAGATAIFVDREPVAFPASGALTIGHYTDIAFSAIEAPNVGSNTVADDVQKGYYKIIVSGVSEAHRIGEAVVSRDSIASPFPDVATNAKFSSFEAAVSMKTALQEILSCNFTVSNNLADEKYILGSRFRAAVIEGDGLVSGSMTVEFDDGELYHQFTNGLKSSLEIALISEDPDLTEVGGIYVPHATYFFFPNIKPNGTTPNVGDTSYIEQEVPFDAFDDLTLTVNTPPLCIFLVNSVDDDF